MQGHVGRIAGLCLLAGPKPPFFRCSASYARSLAGGVLRGLIAVWKRTAAFAAPLRSKKKDISKLAASDLPAWAGASGCSNIGTQPPQDNDDDEKYTAVFEKLEAQRQGVLEDDVTDEDLFRTSVLGGQWQMQRVGREVYGVRVDVRKDTFVWELCNTFNLFKSASFENNIYSEAGGSALSRLWKDRMKFLARVWDAAGRPANKFPSEELQSYEPPEELKASLAAMQGRSLKRATAIKALQPSTAKRSC